MVGSPVPSAPVEEPSCNHFADLKWDPDDSGFARCYDCLVSEGYEYDVESDTEGQRDSWAKVFPS